jgi:hypothetical protein
MNYFEMNRAGSENDLDKQNQNTNEISTQKMPERKLNLGGNEDNDSHEDWNGDNKNPPNPPNEHSTGNYHGQSKFAKQDTNNTLGYSSTFSAFSKVNAQKVHQGTLHSKLVIRKKYEDPTALTSFCLF